MIISGNKYGKLIQKESGKVSHYSANPFNIVGNKWFDISGEGNNGTINGASLTKDGMNFDAVDDYVSGNFFDTAILNDFSISFRSKGLGKVLSSTLTRAFAIWVESTYIRIRRVGFSSIDYTYSINSSVFNSVTYTRLNQVGYLYVNGSLINSKADTHSYDEISNRIGLEGTSYFSGTIQDLKIYKNALTPTQALAYHNQFI